MGKKTSKAERERLQVALCHIKSAELLSQIDLSLALAGSDDEDRRGLLERAEKALKELQEFIPKIRAAVHGQDKADKEDKPLRTLTISKFGDHHYAHDNSNTATAYRHSRELLKSESVFVQNSPTMRSIENIRQECPEIDRLALDPEISSLASGHVTPVQFTDGLLRRLMPPRYSDATLSRYGRDKKPTYQRKQGKEK